MSKIRYYSSLLVTVATLSACDYVPSWLGGADSEIAKLPGERLSVIAVSTELQADESIKAVPLSLPAVNANADWPQHSGGFASASSNLAAGSLVQSDSASAGDGESFAQPLAPRPVVAAGSVFAMDGEGKISAHEAAAIGNKRWVSDGVFEEDISNVSSGGLAYDQGKLYAVSGRGAIVAMDANTGAVIWKKTGYAPFRSAPKVAAGKLYAITIDSQIFAFDTATGEALWNHRGIDETAGILNSVSPVLAGDVIIVPYESGELYALSAADGRELWSNALGLNKRTQATAIFSGIGGDPVVDGDVVFAVSSSGVFAAYSIPLGHKLWERQVASVNTPWITGDYVFVLSADNTLMAMLKYDGRVRWAIRVPSFEDEESKRRPISWRGPVMVAGKLAVVGSHGEMLLVDSNDGKIHSTVDIADDVYTAPVVAGGRVYLVTKSAKLISLQ